MTPTSGEPGRRPIVRALLSLSDKRGLAVLAATLHAHGVDIIATGSTAAAIREAGIPATSVEDVTGFPEILDGRVKTLHPAIHAALLADRDREAHVQQITAMGIAPIDLVVVDLYPFEDALADGGAPSELIEKIDIGGVALIRAAAKNHGSVAVVTSPDQYPLVGSALDAGGFTQGQRQQLAATAFGVIASHDVAIATWMSAQFDRDEQDWPRVRVAAWKFERSLRYGENPHQSAALYSDVVPRVRAEESLASAPLLQGKEMSYNNYVDASAAIRAVADFQAPAVAIIKHANPCGLAIAGTVEEAHALAQAGDPASAFGGVIAANRIVTVAMARQVVDTFTEVILAPGYEDAAVEILRTKPSIRVVAVQPTVPGAIEMRELSGGLLVQSGDRIAEDPSTWTLACGLPLPSDELKDLEFAWRAVRSAKSNAIVIASGGATVGIGMGQVNRVDAARLAVTRAGDRAVGAVAASDAFFPFPDGIEVLAAAGVVAIVQPGGSVRDGEVIAAAEAAGLTMYLTGVRHFWH